MKTKKKTYTVEVPVRRVVVKRDRNKSDVAIIAAYEEKIRALQNSNFDKGVAEGVKKERARAKKKWQKKQQEFESKIENRARLLAATNLSVAEKQGYGRGYNAGKKKGWTEALSYVKGRGDGAAIAEAMEKKIGRKKSEDYL